MSTVPRVSPPTNAVVSSIALPSQLKSVLPRHVPLSLPKAHRTVEVKAAAVHEAVRTSLALIAAPKQDAFSLVVQTALAMMRTCCQHAKKSPSNKRLVRTTGSTVSGLTKLAAQTQMCKLRAISSPPSFSALRTGVHGSVKSDRLELATFLASSLRARTIPLMWCVTPSPDASSPTRLPSVKVSTIKLTAARFSTKATAMELLTACGPATKPAHARLALVKTANQTRLPSAAISKKIHVVSMK